MEFQKLILKHLLQIYKVLNKNNLYYKLSGFSNHFSKRIEGSIQSKEKI